MAAFRRKVAAVTKEEFSIVDRETKEYFDFKFAKIRDRDHMLRETQLGHGQRLRAIRQAQGAKADELRESMRSSLGSRRPWRTTTDPHRGAGPGALETPVGP